MPFARPSLTALIERLLADLSSRVLGVDGAVLRRSVLGVLGRVQAGAAHELHGHLAWIAEQVIIDTADAEVLERWANIWGIARRPAQFAGGVLACTGSDGAVLPAGTVWQRSDGAEFATQVEVTVIHGGAPVAVQAALAGAAGNTAAGLALGLQQPIVGIANTATVAAPGLVNGSDPETDAALRERLLARLRWPPHGGAVHDYAAWAQQVPGVTRVWVEPGWQGLGTVGVLFVRDLDAVIIPDAPEVEAVAAHIERLRPVTAWVFVLAPTGTPLDLTIALSPNTAAVRQAVTAELADLLSREAEPGATVLKSRLDEAIAIAQGEHDHVLIAPAGNVAHGKGEMAVLGTVTFQDL
jgi:uncharacterized phage protein gp47/JayE